MGEAKRRGTFKQRKEQKLNKQYGLTNHQLTVAYQMNKLYNYTKLRAQYHKQSSLFAEMLQMIQ